MNDTDVPLKTPAGSAEVSARSNKLPPRLRAMLIMVDGTQAATQLRQAAQTLGAPTDCLETLAARGLIEARARPATALDEPSDFGVLPQASSLSDAERFRAAQKFMNDSAVDILGLRAFFFTLKLEKCFSCADLQAMLPDFAKITARSRDATVGRVLLARARQLVG